MKHEEVMKLLYASEEQRSQDAIDSFNKIREVMRLRKERSVEEIDRDFENYKRESLSLLRLQQIGINSGLSIGVSQNLSKFTRESENECWVFSDSQLIQLVRGEVLTQGIKFSKFNFIALKTLAPGFYTKYVTIKSDTPIICRRVFDESIGMYTVDNFTSSRDKVESKMTYLALLSKKFLPDEPTNHDFFIYDVMGSPEHIKTGFGPIVNPYEAALHIMNLKKQYIMDWKTFNGTKYLKRYYTFNQIYKSAFNLIDLIKCG